MTDDELHTVFNPGQVEWVRRKAAQDLDEDQAALLLAMVQLEAEIGHELPPDERSAIETLAGQLDGFDALEIQKAIAKMVNQPADPNRKTSWSELRKHKP
ncbi:MAG: hypothetical protein MUQ30_12800 [Anaerolineae bacterium]|nr:hypothetical protein [Anaerolineae bacterium]